MNKKSVCSLALIVSLLGLLSLSVEIQNVHAPHLIITIEADGSISPASANITTSDNVTYTFTADINASIIIQRSNIVIDGDGWTLGGVDFAIMEGFNLTSVSNVTIKNINILEFGYAMWLEGTSHCVISNNTCTHNEGGIWLVSSTENTVSGNTIKRSVEAVALDSSAGNTITSNNVIDSDYGVYAIDNSAGNTISGNNITNNESGLYFYNSSNNTISGNNIIDNIMTGILLDQAFNNTIMKNEITSDNDGMYLHQSSSNNIAENNLTANHGIAIVSSHNNTLHKNIVESTYIGIDIFGDYNIISRNNIINCDTGFFFGSDAAYNTISGNNIKSNDYGLYFEQALNNSIVGNNIANNTYGVYLDWYSLNMQIGHNTFRNNTYHMVASNPDKPNFLDNGIEGNYWGNYTGVDSDHDGIGDSPHVINSNNTDNYPLMGMFQSFNTSIAKSINIICNSTVDNFQYEHPGTIRFHVSNTTASQTHSFCRVSIPNEVMSEPFNVTIDGANPTYWNYTLYNNGTHRWIYFEYEHSTKEVVIVPEFPMLIILPLFMTVTLLAAMAYRRNRSLEP